MIIKKISMKNGVIPAGTVLNTIVSHTDPDEVGDFISVRLTCPNDFPNATKSVGLVLDGEILSAAVVAPLPLRRTDTRSYQPLGRDVARQPLILLTPVMFSGDVEVHDATDLPITNVDWTPRFQDDPMWDSILALEAGEWVTSNILQVVATIIVGSSSHQAWLPNTFADWEEITPEAYGFSTDGGHIACALDTLCSYVDTGLVPVRQVGTPGSGPGARLTAVTIKGVGRGFEHLSGTAYLAPHLVGAQVGEQSYDAPGEWTGDWFTEDPEPFAEWYRISPLSIFRGVPEPWSEPVRVRVPYYPVGGVYMGLPGHQSE